MPDSDNKPVVEVAGAIDLTERPSTLVYITRLQTGYVAGYGWIKEFAFDIPTALRRLASAIEKGK